MNSQRIAEFLEQSGAILAFIVALAAMLGSLYFSEVAGFVPCTLCWYQRILMYPLTVITLVGFIKADEYLPNYVLPLSVIGMVISGYHYLVQMGIFGHPAACAAGIPCNLRYVNYFGFLTIPLMALTAFTLITVIMLGTRWAFTRSTSSDNVEA
jgi:disulfide bond formation protein DsbB